MNMKSVHIPLEIKENRDAGEIDLAKYLEMLPREES